MNDASVIQGYDYGTRRTARSPVMLDELRALERTVGWTEEDDAALAMAGEVLAGQEEAMVDGWRAIIGNHEHLTKWFFGPDGAPDEDYKAAVKKRLVRLVSDTWLRPRDQAWLDYQEEIGLRHTPAKKNRTDGAHTPELVPLRYLLAFAGPATLGTRQFLGRKGHSPTMSSACVIASEAKQSRSQEPSPPEIASSPYGLLAMASLWDL
jgi:hypothetical protein